MLEDDPGLLSLETGPVELEQSLLHRIEESMEGCYVTKEHTLNTKENQIIESVCGCVCGGCFPLLLSFYLVCIYFTFSFISLFFY